MIIQLFRIAMHELTVVYRSKVILLMAGIILLLLLAAAWGGYRNYETAKHIRDKAKREKREQWLHQDPKHPHVAAHFGTFAYKPTTWFSMFDDGLDNYAGAYVYLEPHRQNDFVFKPAEGHGASIRFGQLSVALVLQLLVPLLIIFMGFATVTREREQGTLQLLFSYGIALPTIAAGKVIGQYLALLLLLLPALVLTGAFFAALTPNAGSDQFLRALLLLAVYAGYFFLFTLLTVFVSAIAKTGGNALLLLLTVWIVSCIIMPKAAANMGSDRYPLPAQYTFREAIQRDIKQGIDGHNTSNERARKLEEQLLQQYRVKTVRELPFNFEGYVMQAGEAYSSLVYDKHFHQLQHTLLQQDRFCRVAGIVDPYLAVQGLSMALAATDLYTHIDFQQKTENYRRQFVQKMNEDMMYHSKQGDWGYKASQQLYASVPDFQYQLLPLKRVLALYRMELFSLAALLIAGSGLFYFILKRVPLITRL
jgi:ABC-2 type transport system permease protein